VNLWVRPPEGETKLNVDGSFMASDGKAGAGTIPWAHDGTIIFSACRSLEQCNSALDAELCAIMEGTTLAVERCQQPSNRQCGGCADAHDYCKGSFTLGAYCR
jgi:hypothetical protein